MIDKSTQDLWTTASDLTVGGYKAIFDANGVETLQQSYNNLAPGGRLVTYGIFPFDFYRNHLKTTFFKNNIHTKYWTK